MKICNVCNLEKKNYYFTRSKVKPICRSCRDEARKTYCKKYRKDNKNSILQTNKLYKQNRRLKDPIFRLSNNCSRMINLALNGNKNHYSIWNYLPYTILDLKINIESKFDKNMNWSNYGSYWHLDHIIPQSEFPYNSMADENFSKCWALCNLQPLEASENVRKSNRLNYEVR